MKHFWIKKIIGYTLFAIACIGLLGYVVMNLWNQILVEVVAVKPIDYTQALGIFVLSKILFGGFRTRGNSCGTQQGWKARWKNMTEEEKEQFKQDWRNRCDAWKSGCGE